MKIVATRTDADHGLIDEKEYISTNEELKEIYVEFGWAKPFLDSDPLPPQGSRKYEPGKSYPSERFIYKDNAIYESNCQTSITWILSEWDPIVKLAV